MDDENSDYVLQGPKSDYRPFATASLAIYIVVFIAVILVTLIFLSWIYGRQKQPKEKTKALDCNPAVVALRVSTGTAEIGACDVINVTKRKRTNTQWALFVVAFSLASVVFLLMIRWGNSIRLYTPDPGNPCAINLREEGCTPELREEYCGSSLAVIETCQQYCTRYTTIEKEPWCLDQICTYQLDTAHTPASYPSVDPVCIDWCVVNDFKNCGNFACYYISQELGSEPGPSEEQQTYCETYCATQTPDNVSCRTIICGTGVEAGACACQDNLLSAECNVYCSAIVANPRKNDPICDDWACAKDPRRFCATACAATGNVLVGCEVSEFIDSPLNIIQESSQEGLVFRYNTIQVRPIETINRATDVVVFQFAQQGFTPAGDRIVMLTYTQNSKVYYLTRALYNEFTFDANLETAEWFVLTSTGFQAIFEIILYEDFGSRNARRLNTFTDYRGFQSLTLTPYDSRQNRTQWRLLGGFSLGFGSPVQFMAAGDEVSIVHADLPLRTSDPVLQWLNPLEVGFRVFDALNDSLASTFCGMRLRGMPADKVVLMLFDYPGTLLQSSTDGGVLTASYQPSWQYNPPPDAIWTVSTFFSYWEIRDMMGRYLRVTNNGLEVTAIAPDNLVVRALTLPAQPLTVRSYTYASPQPINCAALDTSDLFITFTQPLETPTFSRLTVVEGTAVEFSWMTSFEQYERLFPVDCFIEQSFQGSDPFKPQYVRSELYTYLDTVWLLDLYRLQTNNQYANLEPNQHLVTLTSDVSSASEFIGYFDYNTGGMLFRTSNTEALVLGALNKSALFLTVQENTQPSLLRLKEVAE